MGTTAQSPHQLSRRGFLALTAFAGTAGTSSLLSGCGGAPSGAEEIRFLQNKPEVVTYFDDLVKEFNASQKDVFVTHDSTPTALVPQFVRGTPPDLALYNYNLETANFVSRGALTDLSGLPQAATITPSVQDLVTQFAQHDDDTSVLPYSVTAAGVIYNKELFDKANVDVPTTWDELVAACEAFKAQGVTPIEQTYKDTWTLAQGLFDYVSGSALDVGAFFEKLKALGGNAGRDAAVSFSQDFKDAATKMIALTAYTNEDAPSRTYADGNAAFAKGDTAMYLQGPWAIGEILKGNKDAQLGTFAMPATDSPDDVRVRVNLDLSLWIPVASSKQDAARVFLEYLMKPDVMNKYNQTNLAWGTTKDSPPIADEHIADLRPYLDAGKFYQGAGTYIPGGVPLGNYVQQLVIDKKVDNFLHTLDDDWARYAQRSL